MTGRAGEMRGDRPVPADGDEAATPLDPRMQAAADGVLARYPAPRRDQLLPIVQEVQAAAGYLPRPLVEHLSQCLGIPFADLYGVVTFYALLSTRPLGRTVLRPCKGISCYLRGAATLGDYLEERLGVGEKEVTPDGAWSWEWMPCLGQCERAPALLVGLEAVGWVTPATLDAILGADGRPVPSGAAEEEGEEAGVVGTPEPRVQAVQGAHAPEDAALAVEGQRINPYAAPPAVQPAILLARCGMVDPTSLDAYLEAGGFLALRKALDLGPEQVIAEVKAANLSGRGAAFSTGIKWELVARQPGPEKYVVLNADESEPGTFNNRVLLEEDPFAILEAMVIAAHAVGATRGYAYVRGEYALAARRLRGAIGQMRERGYLGPHILGQGLAFDVEVRCGGGAYICGEETALFNSLEGYRGEPRSKPPFPTQVGLFRKPTLINNVETLANILPIVLEGGAWFATLGSPDLTGTKLFCLSGHVQRPGLYELPCGAPLRDLVEGCGGGVPAGRDLQAVLVGGATGIYLRPEHLDTPLDNASLRPFGGMVGVGTGAVVVFDDRVDMWEVTRLLAEFFAEESCGQCVPCRVGTRRQVEILHRLSAGAGRAGDALLLEELGRAMGDASICGLGQTAAIAVHSALRTFGYGG